MNLSPIPFDQTSSEKELRLGSVYTDGFGRTGVYVKAGASALARGKLAVSPTVVANHINLSWAVAPAVGDTTVQVTLGATAATKDYYEDGWLVVNDGAGEGRAYPIIGNTAADSAGTITVTLGEAIDTAGTLSQANVDLLANSASAVVISAADQADEAMGWPIVSIAAGEYGFLIQGGYVSALFDEAVAVGLDLTIGSSVAGAVEALDAAGEQRIGTAVSTAGVDTEYQLIKAAILPGSVQ